MFPQLLSLLETNLFSRKWIYIDEGIEVLRIVLVPSQRSILFRVGHVHQKQISCTKHTWESTSNLQQRCNLISFVLVLGKIFYNFKWTNNEQIHCVTSAKFYVINVPLHIKQKSNPSNSTCDFMEQNQFLLIPFFFFCCFYWIFAYLLCDMITRTYVALVLVVNSFGGSNLELNDI